MKHLESVVKKHEAEVLSLEEDKVRLKRVCGYSVVLCPVLDSWHTVVIFPSEKC